MTAPLLRLPGIGCRVAARYNKTSVRFARAGVECPTSAVPVSAASSKGSRVSDRGVMIMRGRAFCSVRRKNLLT